MDTIAQVEDLRSECNLPLTIADEQLEPHLRSAGIELRRLLTPDIYQEVLEEDDEDQRRIDCKKAEAICAFSYALPFLNIETAGSGIVVVKGWDDSRSELMRQGELNELINRLRTQVLNLLNPYLPVEDDDTEDDDENPMFSAGGLSFVAV